MAVKAISSIGEPPSDQSLCECRSPRSLLRSSSPPWTSGPPVSRSSLASRSGVRPWTAASITSAVEAPIPGSFRNVPSRTRSATSSPSGRIVSAALRNAFTL